MSYEMYTTEAIVCGRIVRGEHDLTLRLYTKDAGMVFARAGGARAGESKLRYGLQDFSYANVSLVHGRHEWRVTGASPILNFYYQTETREHRAALRHALRIIRRFLTGASAEPELFESVYEGMRSLALIDPSEVAQSLFTLRTLYRLGYVAPEAAYLPLAAAASLADARQTYETLQGASHAVSHAIEHAFSSSHL